MSSMARGRSVYMLEGTRGGSGINRCSGQCLQRLAAAKRVGAAQGVATGLNPGLVQSRVRLFRSAARLRRLAALLLCARPRAERHHRPGRSRRVGNLVPAVAIRRADPAALLASRLIASRTKVTGEGLLRQYRAAHGRERDFRRVLYTGHNLQLVLMTLPPGERDRRGGARGPRPVLPHRGRFEGVVDIDGVDNRVEDDFAVIVPAGARHNVSNDRQRAACGSTPSTARPSIRTASSSRTKDEAEERHHAEEWDGKTTE